MSEKTNKIMIGIMKYIIQFFLLLEIMENKISDK